VAEPFFIEAVGDAAAVEVGEEKVAAEAERAAVVVARDCV